MVVAGGVVLGYETPDSLVQIMDAATEEWHVAEERYVDNYRWGTVVPWDNGRYEDNSG